MPISNKATNYWFGYKTGENASVIARGPFSENSARNQRLTAIKTGQFATIVFTADNEEEALEKVNFYGFNSRD